MSNIVQVSFMISAILGAAFLVQKLLVNFNNGYRRLMRLVDVLLGRPASGDEPAQPGIDARMKAVEARLEAQDEMIAHLAELKPNGGSTLKDQVNKIEALLAEFIAAQQEKEREHEHQSG